MPSYGNRGASIALKSVWTRDSRAREIPIWNQWPRPVLDVAWRLEGGWVLLIDFENLMRAATYGMLTTRHCSCS